MVSMKDIAQRCGVSVATVSKALNGQQDIGEDTRRRICDAAEKMGYMTNSAARALKTNRTYNLGVLFVDERHSGLAHEYFSAVLESFKTEAEAHGYDITFLNHNVGGKPTTYLQHCRYRGLDGVVIACVDFTHPQVQELVDSAMSWHDLDIAIGEKYKEVNQLETSMKVAKLDLEKKQSELGDGNVYAEFDGTVKAVRNATEAYNSNEAVVEVSGGGGYYVTGTLSEMDLGSVKIGDTVQISSWRTGVSCEGKIVSIDSYPTQNGSNWGDGNSNVSYYPFQVFVSEDANLQPNDYVEMQYQKSAKADAANSMYLQSFLLRSENGKSYVMVRGENDKLEKRWVQTGRDLWGSYTQIRGGLTLEDYVAFPYGRDVVEGAHTKEATADQLYSGM